MLKRTIIVLSLFFTTLLIFSFSKENKPQPLKTIVIDAGHGIRPNGGYDGARGAYSFEDEICFDVSQELIRLIRRDFPDLNIIQTRTTRNIVTLQERARIANRNNGELFISIHVNAAPPIQQREFLGYRTEVDYVGKGKKKKKVTRQVPQYRNYTIPNPAKGTETYIWGAHKNEDKEIAIRENAPMFAEENYQETYGPIDPNSPEFIALSLVKTKQFFKRSATFAAMVEDQFIKVGRTSRGQKQRQVGIWVLQATAMPSVLVETGYITNRAEEDYLNSKQGQEEIALCIKNALAEYISWLTKNQTGTAANNKKPATTEDTYKFLEALDKREREMKGLPKK